MVFSHRFNNFLLRTSTQVTAQVRAQQSQEAWSVWLSNIRIYLFLSLWDNGKTLDWNAVVRSPPTPLKKKKKPQKTTTKEFSLNSPRFGPAAGISSRLHRPAWSGFNPASLSAWEMRNFAALEELDKHKEQRPQRAEISQTSAAWQAGQPGLILEWWLLPPCIDTNFQVLETLKNYSRRLFIAAFGLTKPLLK